MRVAHKTIYETARYELGNTLEELNAANVIVSTGKRINNISDDPVGVTQLLDVQSNMDNLNQIERNISVGKTWLNSSEASLSSVSDILSEAMTLSEQMANGTYNASQREMASGRVDGIIRQMIQFGNTKVNGQYIFSGSRTNILPFDVDDDINPTQVIYSGNTDTFSIQTAEDVTIGVGNNGDDIFRYSVLDIDSSNNRIQFIEHDNGVASAEITATIPDGTYTKKELAVAMRNAMDAASEKNGGNVHYKVDYDDATQKYTISDNGSKAGVNVELLFESGSAYGKSVAPYIGFDPVDVRDAMMSDTVTGTFPVTIDATNNTIIISEDNGSGPIRMTVTLPNAVNQSAEDVAAALELQMDTQSAANGYGINYDVSYDAANQHFVFQEAETTQLKELKILEKDSDPAALSMLGFSAADHTLTRPTSDNQADWSSFKALIDFRDALRADDRDGIARAMTYIKTHFEHVESRVSKIGSNEIRLDIRSNVITDIKLSLSDREAKIEDANVLDAVSNLKLKEFAYEASLASSSRVIKMSLANYI